MNYWLIWRIYQAFRSILSDFYCKIILYIVFGDFFNKVILYIVLGDFFNKVILYIVLGDFYYNVILYINYRFLDGNHHYTFVLSGSSYYFFFNGADIYYGCDGCYFSNYTYSCGRASIYSDRFFNKFKSYLSNCTYSCDRASIYDGRFFNKSKRYFFDVVVTNNSYYPNNFYPNDFKSYFSNRSYYLFKIKCRFSSYSCNSVDFHFWYLCIFDDFAVITIICPDLLWGLLKQFNFIFHSVFHRAFDSQKGFKHVS